MNLKLSIKLCKVPVSFGSAHDHVYNHVLLICCKLLRRSTPLEMVVLLQSMPLYCCHKGMSGHSLAEHLQCNVCQLDSDQFSDFFLKSRNLKDPITSPNTNSTDVWIELIAWLKSSISGVRSGSLKGPCKCMRWGYAGSPYRHMASPAGLNAWASSSFSNCDSFSIPASCFLPSINYSFD